MGRYDFDWGIKTLRNQGIDIPDCDSIDDYYTALEKVATIYANQPGKLYWIYAEMRMVKVKDGTKLQLKMMLCTIANRFIMNYPEVFTQGIKAAVEFRKKRLDGRDDLYRRLNTMEIIAPFNKPPLCNNCNVLNGKTYLLDQDLMPEWKDNKANFVLPTEVSEVCNTCTNANGCTISIG